MFSNQPENEDWDEKLNDCFGSHPCILMHSLPSEALRQKTRHENHIFVCSSWTSTGTCLLWYYFAYKYKSFVSVPNWSIRWHNISQQSILVPAHTCTRLGGIQIWKKTQQSRNSGLDIPLIDYHLCLYFGLQKRFIRAASLLSCQELSACKEDKPFSQRKQRANCYVWIIYFYFSIPASTSAW